jgi:hypothetical protein
MEPERQRSAEVGDDGSGAAGPAETDWVVRRSDDNGNRFEVARNLTRADAERIVAEFEARGHKQLYWAERDADSDPESVANRGDAP